MLESMQHCSYTVVRREADGRVVVHVETPKKTPVRVRLLYFFGVHIRTTVILWLPCT